VWNGSCFFFSLSCSYRDGWIGLHVLLLLLLLLHELLLLLQKRMMMVLMI
jgi:hypothetical protein